MEFIQIENKLNDILNNNRITEKTADNFKQLLQNLKNLYGINLSKESFKENLNRNDRKNINIRLNRIIKKANITTARIYYYYSELTNIKGNLYKHLYRKPFNILIA